MSCRARQCWQQVQGPRLKPCTDAMLWAGSRHAGHVMQGKAMLWACLTAIIASGCKTSKPCLCSPVLEV
eukprot:1158507-Pelagomonas_calceolata.AAC.3